LYGTVRFLLIRIAVAFFVPFSLLLSQTFSNLRQYGKPDTTVNNRYLAKWLLRLAVNAKVAAVLGSIPASTDTGKFVGRQMKQF
jgi:hypothetical protein